MQFYAATVVTVFTLLFSVLYLVPPVRNLAYFLSLSVVLVIASHYTTVWLLYLLAYKTVTPKGKVVVVTRCDSGYGNRLAIELDRRGFTVVAGCVNEQSDGSRHIKEVCSERVYVVQTDVTQPESLVVFESMVRTLCKNENQLWAVIINLSVVSLGELEWYTDEDMRWTYEVNVLCVARVARAFLPLLRESPYYGRRFVIVNSVWGRISVPGTGPYCMSKFAVRCFTEVLRRELLKFGIYVVAVEPNLYRLPQTEPSTLLNSYKAMWEKLPDSIKDVYSKVRKKQQI
ncbi:dehydrogenase, putative [Ixodes scapularis]|uniref:Dehydrogenase, putative n=1 Tax=Ixodes scapularis TaxID=6945 RepID=B7P5R6_IXOSC|nr:dehydrogenase, putative [Ixodes scapularis]|eukprot:XP_002407806.1 dehydrogenase, putative [Ixodes scapularis]